MEDDALQKLIGRSIAYISLHPRSEKEIHAYLAKVAMKLEVADDEVIQAAFQRLVELKYVDDYEYARLFIESRLRGHPRGPKVLVQELRKKGIPDEVITEVCATFFPKNTNHEEELVIARKIVQKKYSYWHTLSLLDQKKKIFSLLSRRGFSSDVIHRLIDEFTRTNYNT
jgi:regulatory protein